MELRNLCLGCCLFLLLTVSAAYATPVLPTGQIPGPRPEILAPGFINTGIATRDITMSPDGTEIYFCVYSSGYSHASILFTRFENGVWTDPEVTSFSGSAEYADLEPALSPDGNDLFFYSSRPAFPGAVDCEDIWVVHRRTDGWSEPENIGAPINTAAAEFFPSVTSDGTLYFCRADSVARVHEIFRSRLVDGKYQEPARLGNEVNSGRSQFNAWVSPDESRLIVPVAGHEKNLGGVDYWLCQRSDDDVWSWPQNLGPVVNDGSGQSWSPYVSPDKELFFFMSSRLVGAPVSWPLSWSELQGRHRQPGSGRPGIFVMQAGFLDHLDDQQEVVAKDEIEVSVPDFPFPSKAGKYWGMPTPGLKPEIFAPEIVSTGLIERDINFSRDGQFLTYGIMDMGLVTTMYCRWDGQKWSEPVTAPWHGDSDFVCFESVFSADSQTVFFLSNRAAPGQTQGRGWANQNIFASRFVDGKWSEAEALPGPVTTDRAEYFPSVAWDGTLYFTREDEEGKSSLWVAEARADGLFDEAVRLPAEVNVGENNYNGFVAPDESFIIFCVNGHDDNLGVADYWISFKGEDGKWLAAVNMGGEFNGEDTRASSAFLSPDGEVLFFSSSQEVGVGEDGDGRKLSREDYWEMHTLSGMGSLDLWWVDAGVLGGFGE